MVSERAVKALKEESCPACGVSYGELANKETRSPIIKLALSEDEKTAETDTENVGDVVRVGLTEGLVLWVREAVFEPQSEEDCELV